MYDIHFNWHPIIKLHACTYKYNSFYQKVRVQRTDYPRGIMLPFFLPKHHLHSNPDTQKYFSLIHVHKSKTICMLSISIYSYLPFCPAAPDSLQFKSRNQLNYVTPHFVSPTNSTKITWSHVTALWPHDLIMLHILFKPPPFSYSLDLTKSI